MLLSWLARRIIGYVMAQNRAGNIRPALLLDAPGVVLRFPGDNSWSGTYRGREQVKAWLQRMVAAGVHTFPDEVVASGPPWRTTVCVRGHDEARAPQGELIYENRFVIWGHLRWGRLTDYEVYEDTLKPRALDEYLERTGHPAARGQLSGAAAG